jgi:Ni/Fe-hydrogenase subunit HybB-like protein
VPEILITVGMLAIELAAFIWLVKTFPILSGTRPPVHGEA